MNTRFAHIAAIAAANHGVLSLDALQHEGIPPSTVRRWVAEGLLHRLGPRSFLVAGAPLTWKTSAGAALADCGPASILAGRTAARLHGLDGFVADEPELLLPAPLRRYRSTHRVVTTSRPIDPVEIVRIDGLRCLRADRLILDAPLFDFTRGEIENAIDSAIRLRRVSEQRLRTRVVERHTRGVNGGRMLVDALVDSGGQSRLERWFLRLVRQAGLPRPRLQRTYRDESRIVARVDAYFPGDVVVEVEGHGTHSSRRQRQHDEQRRTELTLRGIRVLTFTYLDIRDRPAWVVARLREALALTA